MDNQQSSPVQQKNLKKIIWFCFSICIIIYFLIGRAVLIQHNKTIAFNASELSNPLFIFFVMLSLVVILIAHAYLPKFQETDEKKKNTINFTQYALSEAVAIFGLVLVLINGSFTQLVILCAFSLVSLFRMFPQES
jgi:hypothetical protein